ncbi:MAG: TVP38/TMEM64 family protein [Proteobacteria bacterium]|nr:TVP38/TMEM64 family protein [Pseudomonadota bacterium]
MSQPVSRRKRRFARAIGALLLAVIAVMAAGALGWLYMGLEEEFSAKAVEAEIRSWGGWGVAVSVILMVIHSFIPFPAEVISLANGMIYGPLWGTVITWGSAMLGAFLAFALSRALGRPFVEIVVSEKNWHVVDAWAARHGADVLLLARFVPVISFNLINYAAGLTPISWWTFAWTTGIGILPMTVLMVLMGDHYDHLSWEAWAGLLAGGVALWFVLRRWLATSRAKARETT